MPRCGIPILATLLLLALPVTSAEPPLFAPAGSKDPNYPVCRCVGYLNGTVTTEELADGIDPDSLRDLLEAHIAYIRKTSPSDYELSYSLPYPEKLYRKLNIKKVRFPE